jgi:hypothetical protein
MFGQTAFKKYSRSTALLYTQIKNSVVIRGSSDGGSENHEACTYIQQSYRASAPERNIDPLAQLWKSTF